MRKRIVVYADWQDLPEPMLMGILNAESHKGTELFSFEYSTHWLDSRRYKKIDPNLSLFPGVEYPPENKKNFGAFEDASPDRWGITLMKRRESILAREEGRSEKTLLPSDFLLGVFDQYRMGALRFKLDQDGPFINDNKAMAAPPFITGRSKT
jgi:serine/threonine-protein kinase HipA